MSKKDLGLLILILVVGAVVAIINPRFLLPINLANTSNLIGLFGILSIGQAFVIITGGIELSVGSVIALLGMLFVDFIAMRGMPWPLAFVLILALGAIIGLVHGWLITRLKMQPFVVTLCGLLDLSRRRALLHRRRHGRLRLRPELPGTRIPDRRPQLWRAEHLHRADRHRHHHVGGAAPLGVRPLSLRHRQERGGGDAIPASAPAASSSRPMSSAAC